MPSTYSPNLRVELIGTGEQSGTWGSTTNNNLGTILESAICGYVAVTVSGTAQALTAFNGVEDQSRNMVIDVYGSLTDDFVLYIPPAEKYYVVRNNTTQTAGKTFKVGAATALNGTTSTGGTQVTIPSKASAPYNASLVFCDATNVSEALTYVNNLTAGSLTLTTRLPETSGGVPTQTGFGSCFLTTDGTNAYWSGTGIKTVVAATTPTSGPSNNGNITLSGEQTIDGVALTEAAKSRVLLKNQTAPAENGIYVVKVGAWERAADADTAAELAGSIVNVQQGSTNGGTQWATSFKDAGAGITANTWNSVVPLPAQTTSGGVSQANKFLTTDGTNAAWASPAAKTVRVATTSAEINIAVNGSAPNSVDGVALNLNDRILVKNQVTNPAQNGIYYVTTVGTGTDGVWARAADAISAADIAGSVVIVQAGTTNGGTQWTTTFTSNTGSIVGSTAMTWNQPLLGTIPATGGGTGVTTYAAGDILYASTINPSALSKLAAGTANNGKFLTVSAGLPVWGSGPSGGLAIPSSTGIVACTNTGTGATSGRTISSAGAGSGITVSNGNGVSGNPTISINSAEAVLSIKGQSSDTAQYGNVLLSNLASFANSLSATGYQKLPGGLIIQWGTGTVAGNTSTTADLALTYTVHLAAVGTVGSTDVSTGDNYFIYPESTSKVHITNGLGTSVTYWYISIGY